MEKSKLAFSLFLCALIYRVAFCYAGTSSDKLALLQFKSAISADPSGLLSTWNPSDESPCSWNGVTCNSKTRRVSSLELSCNPYSTIPGNLNLNSNFIPCLRLGFDFYGKGSSVCFSNGTSSESNSGNRTDCKLTGKLSPFIGELSEIRVLSLSFNEFFSEVPREIGRLGLLEVLELGGNRFTGSLPRELGDLRLLRVLDLGFNDFIGEIPASIANCDMLQNVSFAGNRLNGTVPAFFVRFRKLRSVSLSFNRFSGSIPNDLGQECEFLQHLHLAGNYLTGSIPIGLGNCSKLRSLLLFSNMLDSGIPPDLGRLLMLQVLDLSRNFLSGVIPAELGNCRQLKVLILKNIFNPMLFGNNVGMGSWNSSNYIGDYNYFEGGIPDSVVTLPNLRILWAPNLNLEGIFPHNWGSCSSLQMVNFAQNFFTGEIPASLGKCKSLYYLDLSFNQLTGRLPKEIPVSCMVMFNVSRNLLVGDIPIFSQNGCREVFVPFENRGSVVPLNPSIDLSVYYSYFYSTSHENTFGFALASNHLAIFHDFSRNHFTGPIPPMPLASDRLLAKPVYEFLLNGNKLEGSIPGYLFDLCSHLDSLIIDLGENTISGELPLDIGIRCKCIKYLGLAGNGLVGSVPPSFEHLVSLVYLDLSRNKLQGQIPAFFGQMKDLRYLSLSGNRFIGNIPLELAQLSPLEVLKLSSNSLTGDIPFVFAKLVNLSVLQLDNNKLSGNIPSSFGNITSLSVFNVSFNNLSGPIPPNMIWIKCDAIQGNPNLQPCRVTSKSSSPSEEYPGVPQSFAYPPAGVMPTKSHHRFSSAEIASIISAFVIVSVLLVLVILFFFMRMCVPRSGGQGLGRKDVITFHNNGFQLTYENIVRATAGFSVQNCIGNGGFGATYRADVTPNVAVAVKRLAVGRFQGIQQFKAEIITLGRVRHPNLVTLIGYHVSEAEMFLIYNYLPGGNLEKFIQDRSKRPVNWSMLHKIALDIAHALAYLHDECVPRILHRDIKPSNILLDNNFNAYLSDFGLARLLGTSETHATTDVAGTFGYVAPEYAMTCRVSDKADVYSYGIVLLELISDKRALDPSFSCYGHGFNIVTWVCMLLRQGRASEFFVAGLWDNGSHADLIETLHLAVMCTVDSLSSRPSMKQVVQRLKQIEPLTC